MRWNRGKISSDSMVLSNLFQTAYAMEQAEQPGFRRFMEDQKFYEVPARFAIHTAYMEVSPVLWQEVEHNHKS